MRIINSGRPIDEAPAHILRTAPRPPPARIRFRDERVVSLDDKVRSNLVNVARFVDGGMVFVSGVAAHATVNRGVALPVESLFVIGFLSILAVNLFHAAALYRGTVALAGVRSILLLPLLFGAALLAVPATAAAAGVATWPEQALPWLVRWGSIGVAALPLGRLGLRAAAWALRRDARFRRRFLIVGDAARAQEVVAFLAGRGDGVNTVVDVLSDRPAAAGVRRFDDEVDAAMRGGRVDDVVVALPWDDARRMAEVMGKLRQYPVDVHLFPDRFNPVLHSRGISLLSGVPMLQLSSRPLTGLRAFAKAAEDRVLGLAALLVALPVMTVVALAIRLESAGPVIYRQKRYGYNNEVFTVFKFRSMYAGADAPGVVVQASRQDPRVTRVGRWLRRTSLDELPQIFNVLNGSMSMVGPRPHAVEHQNYYQHLVDEYRCRHRMKPGITGWAQIHGFRGETKDLDLMRKRVEHDLYYIENWSIFLDLWILLMTPIVCMWGKNAY